MNMHTLPAKRGPKPNINTRENLILAGVKLIHDAGFAATGVQEIVNEAGVPKGSFYNHFTSKEDFGREVVEFYFTSGVPALRDILADLRIPPLDRMRNYFEQRIEVFKQTNYVRGCLMGNLSLEIADHSGSIRDTLAANFKEWSIMFENCVAEAQKSGAVQNPIPSSVLAQFILNSWEGALLRMRVEKNDQPLRDFCVVVFSSLLI
ncbi:MULTISPECIES: TetR/AcrR family transcriptional regulator [Serratia]|uniref:TetR/AcrR family transcriptional regulator n=1 Tax=Serratia TaxID=613 RepID=UPI0029EEDD2D|nr:TetR family transcriptional regulator C-terminal domain-containing protein [Serratia marcescens]HEJ8055415.1 TetR family transcriptional regulator C-terminal domain-containing protein [Serratia marcescens]